MEGIPSTPQSADAGPPTKTPDAGTPTPDAPQSVLAKFNDWMKCMTFADFQAAGMSPAWNNVIATGNTRCETCHENGAEGFIVTNDEQKFFDTLKENPYYALQYFAPQVGEPFEVLANEIAMRGVAQGLDPHREHPRFDPEPGLAASRDLAAKTQWKYKTGTCGP